jgi:hypothetical protein
LAKKELAQFLFGLELSKSKPTYFQTEHLSSYDRASAKFTGPVNFGPDPNPDPAKE